MVIETTRRRDARQVVGGACGTRSPLRSAITA